MRKSVVVLLVIGLIMPSQARATAAPGPEPWNVNMRKSDKMPSGWHLTSNYFGDPATYYAESRLRWLHDANPRAPLITLDAHVVRFASAKAAIIAFCNGRTKGWINDKTIFPSVGECGAVGVNDLASCSSFCDNANDMANVGIDMAFAQKNYGIELEYEGPGIQRGFNKYYPTVSPGLIQHMASIIDARILTAFKK